MRSNSGQCWAFAAVVLAATLLHAYENLPREGIPITWGWFLWSLSPYAVFSLVFRMRANGVAATAAASAAFAVDLWIHYSVFVAPTGSTAALALIFIPLWNTLLVGPVVMLLVWSISRRRKENADAL